MSRPRRRANGEGSIYPVHGGYRGYVWVTGTDDIRRRKYVKGRTYEEARKAWLTLQSKARERTMPASMPTVAQYLAYWSREVVEPNLAPKTYEKYEMFSRLYIAPGLGARRLDRLEVRHLRPWLNQLRQVCQCCAQGKDTARPAAKRRCCAIGRCCGQQLSDRTVKDIRDTLRSALSNAVAEELAVRNMAAVVRLPAPRKTRRSWWSVDEARAFLESARLGKDPLYAAYVLVLVLGLRRGEVLGLTWPDISLDTAEVTINWQLQRSRGQLHHRETKTPGSSALLPLPEICATALKLRAEQQGRDRAAADDAWQETGLVFTTAYGTPYVPRNFARHFTLRCSKASVRAIRVHDTRRTCASLLVALNVHPSVAMQILRHSQIAVTMEIYSEVPSEATQEALKRLGDSLDGYCCTCCCTKIRNGQFGARNRPLSWVGDTGIEPVTSSV
jgi:integrase